MSDSLTFDAEALAGLSARLTERVAEIDEVLHGLETAAAALGGQWTGAAQQAYDRAQKQWTTAMAELRGVAADCARVAARAGDRYDAVERSNVARVRLG